MIADQILLKTLPEIHYFFFSPSNSSPFLGPLQVPARDFGYEIDEQNLAEELLAPLSISFPDPNHPDVDPDDFETVYRWYLS